MARPPVPRFPFAALLLATALAGCQRASPAQPEDAATARPASAPTAVAPQPPPPEPPAVDADAPIPGTFTGTLPCAGCPGIEATLRLHADGGYELSERRAGSGDMQVRSGVWFASEDGRAILIADGEDAGDHHIFEWYGDDALKLLATDPPTDPEADHLLQRAE